MPAYYTAGGWILAFQTALRNLGCTKSCYIDRCQDHADCVTILYDGHREHILWKTDDPDAVAQRVTRDPL
jgi:hypothetical protein